MVKKVFKSIPTFFFYLFLLSIPLQARIVFLSGANFNEYTSYFLYISDIFLIITLISWFVKELYSRAENVSRETPNQISDSVRGATSSKKRLLFTICYLLFAILFWSFFSLIWAQNIGVGLFRAIKLTEFTLLFLFVIHNIKTQKRLFWTVLCITATGFFQAIIGIWQYFIQHSIGLKWLGETILSPNMPGVAKIEVAGQKIMRAYGTFPHPNVFAGFLLLSITCGLLVIFFMENRNQLIENRKWYGKRKIENSMKNGNQKIEITNFQFPISKLISNFYQLFSNFKTLLISSKQAIFHYLLIILISVQIIALILTFSRTAWVGAICLFVYLFICLFRGKLLTKSLKLAILTLTLVILVSVAVFWPQISSRFILEGQALKERGLYNNVAFSMIKKSPILGVGMGNFVDRMDEFTPAELQSWQYQPVHNIYLLILAELGIIGFILFTILISNVLKTAWLCQKSPNVSRETSRDSLFIIHYSLFIVLIGFLFIGFFDHYFWTLQQGGLMFWLVLGILYSLILRIRS